ncbi:MAG: caspase family protein [Bacteroidetes bacterium]|nr:caspase family protein [Bacteroidota bacterium]
MKIISSLSFLFLSAFLPLLEGGAGGCKAQSTHSVVLEKTFGTDYEDQGKTILATPDGGFIIGGWTKSSAAGTKDALIIKMNANGEKEWEKVMGKEGEDGVNCAALSPDGNYVFAGFTTNMQDGLQYWWVFSLDKTGKVLWEVTFGGSEWDAAKAMIALPDGYAITGVRMNKGDQDMETSLLRINKKGGKIWETPFGIRYYDDEGNALAQYTDESFIVAGWSKKDIGPNKRIHVAKVDKRGNVEWEKIFGGEVYDFARAVTVTPDGRILVAAVTRSKTNGEEDIRVLKLNAKGEAEWDNNYGGSRTEQPTSMVATADNGCIIAGWTNTIGNGKEKIFLMRLDRKGNILYERYLGTRAWDAAEQIIPLGGGNWLIGGWAASAEADNTDFLAMKVSDNYDQSMEKYVAEKTSKGDSRSPDEIKKEVAKNLLYENKDLSFAAHMEDTVPRYRGSGDPLKGLNVSKAKSVHLSEYYLLVIGIDNYTGTWPALKTAVKDALGVETALKNKYKFDHVRTLYNEKATRTNIIRELEWLVDNVSSNDNVLIYYSGHGDFKPQLNKGYWVPQDAASSSTSNFISNSDIQTFMGGILASHTLLISDACFSGDIFRGNTTTITFEESDKYYSTANSLKSRQAITSGGIEPVMDNGKGGHSVFCYYLLQALEANEKKFLDASQLFAKIKVPVKNNSDQTPAFNPIKGTGDEGGQFIFMKK